MKKTLLAIFLCTTLSGCSFFGGSSDSVTSEAISGSMNIAAKIGDHINKIHGFEKAKITPLKDGKKKYVVVNRFEPMSPMPCTSTDIYAPCMMDMGMAGSEHKSIYFVDSKGIIYDTDFDVIEIPVGGQISYIR